MLKQECFNAENGGKFDSIQFSIVRQLTDWLMIWDGRERKRWRKLLMDTIEEIKKSIGRIKVDLSIKVEMYIK